MALKIKQIQTGSTSLANLSSSVTAGIGAVVLANSFIRFSYRSLDSENNPKDALIRTKFNSTTQINFERFDDENDFEIEWEVVEFTSGSNVSVDEVFGTDLGPSDTVSCSITDEDDTFILWSYLNGGNNQDGDDVGYPVFNSTSQIGWRLYTGNVDAVTMYLIESSDIEVQHVSNADESGSSFDTSISTIVETRSTVITGCKSDSSTAEMKDIGGAEINSTTNIKTQRASGVQFDYRYQVVEFPSDWSTDWAWADINTSQISVTLSIDIDDVDSAFLNPGFGNHAIPSTQRNSGAGDNYQDSLCEYVLTSETVITVTRGHADTGIGTVTFSEVIQGVLDTAVGNPYYAYRQQ